MKLLLLLLIPSMLNAQTFILRRIAIGNTNDSLYMKEGSPDSLWRKNGGATYNFAYISKERNYFPAFQLSGTVNATSIDWINVINKPSSFTPTTHSHVITDVTNLQTSLNAKQDVITVLPFANGGVSGANAAPATTGTMTINMTASVITIQPTGACTFNASGGIAGQTITFAVTTSGTTSFVLTFGTNFRKVGTLATGTVSARFFSVTFVCLNGTIWQEVSRTAAQT